MKRMKSFTTNRSTTFVSGKSSFRSQKSEKVADDTEKEYKIRLQNAYLKIELPMRVDLKIPQGKTLDNIAESINMDF